MPALSFLGMCVSKSAAGDAAAAGPNDTPHHTLLSSLKMSGFRTLEQCAFHPASSTRAFAIINQQNTTPPNSVPLTGNDTNIKSVLLKGIKDLAASATWMRLSADSTSTTTNEQAEALSTRLDEVDTALEHRGLRRGVVTELCGPSACYKTQICLNACVSALAQPTGDVVYVDTSRGCSAQRLRDLVKGAGVAEGELARVSVARPADVIEVLRLLDDVVEHKRELALLVVDSAACVLAPIVGASTPQAAALVQAVGLRLRRAAHETGAAVVVTNHAVRGPAASRHGGDAPLVAALGQAWLSAPHTRVMLTLDSATNALKARATVL